MTDQSASHAPCNPVATFPRLRRLLVVHLVLALAPVACVLVPPDLRFLPLFWALFSVSYGQLMLLSFWVAMGEGSVIRRFLGALLGAAYVAIAPLLLSILSPYSTTESSPIAGYLTILSVDFALVLLFAGGYWLMRRWFFELGRIPDPGAPAPPRFQFSILHLLILTSIAAVVLGLTRSARSGNGTSMEWQVMPAMALTLVVFLVNSLYAARASLMPGRIGVPIGLVCIVAVLLGISLAIVSGHDRFAWWVFPCSVLATSLPAVIVVASLLVVRSCGYRLIPKLEREP